MHRLRDAWRLRWLRRRLLLRAVLAGRRLTPVADRTDRIGAGQVLLAAVMRNEALRLPHFLDHYRRLGIDHFLIVDNASDDGTGDLLRGQADVSLWLAPGSYRDSRFGRDWTNALLMRHAHRHWVLTVDADELLIYPYAQSRDLHALTGWLEQNDADAMAAMMLDLYPKGPLDTVYYQPGQDPTATLGWFDAGNFGIRLNARTDALWIQGGARARMFFADSPTRAPTLTKVPLVRWDRRYAYLNSTHALLPRRLNRVYAADGGELTSGLLLHTKFLPNAAEKSAEDLTRRQHFARPEAYRDYHQAVMGSPDFWHEASTRLGGWRQLEALGLMSRGGWI